jgi:hypothetical protein
MSKTLNLTAKRREALELIARNEHVHLCYPLRPGSYPAYLLVLAGPDKGANKSLEQQTAALERAGLVKVDRALGRTSYRVRATDAGKALVA